MINQKLIFITGKGGVGKSTTARAVAETLAHQGKKTLLVEMLPPAGTKQKIVEISKNLFFIPLEAQKCFNEYVQLKLKIKAIYTLFLDNRITQYLEKAAPGIKELVLIGKVWFDRLNYDHVVVDMPSTGYAAAMFNTPVNFANLFPGGPIYKDCKDMITTFSDPATTAIIALTLLEEMPVQETLEFIEKMKLILPGNPPKIWVNRKIEVQQETRNFFKGNQSKIEKLDSNPIVRGLNLKLLQEKNQNEHLDHLKSASKAKIENTIREQNEIN